MHARDEQARKPDYRVARERATASTDGPAHLLDLQQASGNAAVARLVQRRERPASTDIADVIEKPGSGASHGPSKPADKALKPNPEVAKYRDEAEKNAKTFEEARNRGAEAQKDTSAPKSATDPKAIAYFERAYELDPAAAHGAGLSTALYQLYKALGDTPHAMYWLHGGPSAK